MESSPGPLSSSQEQSSPYLFIHLLEQIFVVLSYLELEKFVTVSNSWLTQRPCICSEIDVGYHPYFEGYLKLVKVVHACCLQGLPLFLL